MEVIIKKHKYSLNLIQAMQIVLSIVLAILLASCSHVRKGDGPPSFPVDETRIPNAVPKPEKLSKYNLPVYRVKGKTYKTLKSSKNFQQVGVASWYGTLFHTRRTSSGEPYNMLAMTAAHKTLPLPTYVEVVNLKNKRKIIVKVNDRGPFKDNRIIDLSYVAAKKLGMIGHGTTMVKVTAIDPYRYQRNLMLAKEKARPTPFKDSIHTTLAKHHTKHHTKHHDKDRYLAIGSFKNRLHATRLKEKLHRELKVPVLITESRSARYLVQVGPLHDAKAAALIKKRLVKMKVIT
jgi:rare lipoprotein A